MRWDRAALDVGSSIFFRSLLGIAHAYQSIRLSRPMIFPAVHLLACLWRSCSLRCLQAVDFQDFVSGACADWAFPVGLFAVFMFPVLVFSSAGGAFTHLMVDQPDVERLQLLSPPASRGERDDRSIELLMICCVSSRLIFPPIRYVSLTKITLHLSLGQKQCVSPRLEPDPVFRTRWLPHVGQLFIGFIFSTTH